MSEFISISILPESIPVAKSLLDARKVPYLMKGESGHNYFGLIYNATWPVFVLVPEKYKDLAEELLDGL